MARERLTFRQRDLNAALKTMQDRGIKVGRIEVRKDGIDIIPADGLAEPLPAEVEDDGWGGFDEKILKIKEGK